MAAPYQPGACIAVGGHSARRSGAKFYAPALWPLLSLQLVGRWAGATVLVYVEEALKERALQPDGAPVALPAAAPGATEGGAPSVEAALPPLAARIAKVEEALGTLAAKEHSTSEQAAAPPGAAAAAGA